MTPQEIIQMLQQGQYPAMPGQPQQAQQPVSDFGIGTLAPTGAQGQALTNALGNLSQTQSQSQQQQLPSPEVSQQVMGQLGVKQPKQATQTSGGTGYTTHVVKPGDTLWGIAHQYTGNGDNWTKLGGFHQDPRTLQPGTQIQIPNSMLSKQKNIGKAPSNVASSGGLN
jgi:nucleoid-associated protein YgaU